jgi:hypothetical protein
MDKSQLVDQQTSTNEVRINLGPNSQSAKSNINRTFNITGARNGKKKLHVKTTSRRKNYESK